MLKFCEGMMMRKVLILFSSLFASNFAYSHHGSCLPLGDSSFSSCGAHSSAGLEMNLIVPGTQLTTRTQSAILCVSEGKVLDSIVAHWVEYLHDDYQGEVPSAPVLRSIAHSSLPGTCSILEFMHLDQAGAWSVLVKFKGDDQGVFVVEVEEDSSLAMK
ncbi:MAG: hypothetical protein ACOH5I_10065 [Oligoflexus sp.]